MSVHDEDILDFDFVDDATVESSPTQREGGGRPPGDPPGGGGRGPTLPKFRSPRGWTPLLRLVGLIAFAILIAVLLLVWAQGCSSDKKQSSYATYMTDMGAVGTDSAKIGKDLASLLTSPGLTEADLEKKLAGLVQRQQQGITRAEGLHVPGPLRPSNDHALEALQLRTSGMQGLLNTFKVTASSKDAAAAGELLAAQGRRLDASDVVWADLFKAPAQKTMQDEGVTGISAPASVFVDNPELYSAKSMASIWTRIHGASTGGTPGGLHGNALSSVTVQPSGQQLSTDTENTIVPSTDLAFDVAVTNTGDFQEVGVQVTMTIPGQKPITKTQTIDLIDQGETQTVTFTNIGEPQFGEKTTLQVSVKPVAGEQNTANNSAEYPVIFSLSP